MRRREGPGAGWDATSVRGLRRQLNLTQQQLADALGVRQQTISEWETGMYRPRGASARMLSVIADGGDQRYEAPESSQRTDNAR
jgi:DNA-binding transcriptional regulator YiaG